VTPPRLILISDLSRGPEALLRERIDRCLAAARPGTVLVSLREHALGARARLALGRALLAAARAHGQRFGVNDRLDLARLLGADAVHLGERSVSVADARQLLPGAWISVASHDPLDERPGADAVLLSPILAPRHGRAALGVEAVARARARFGDGVLYALGGVTPDTVPQVLSAGADGVAAIGAVLSVDDPAPLLLRLGILR
jgi:thiamine-phosphate pyrophosphorylase